jgi:pyruvate formate lyase activating enzyme
MPDSAAGTAAVTARLRVGGLVPFTTTDYPGALAAVVFCQGCPWKCGYCHNPHLLPARGETEDSFERILDWLALRRGLLDAVVFSGGEPTAQAELSSAIDVVRAMGFRIGLHTAGVYPRRLASLLARVDWIGLDIKAPASDYDCITGAPGSGRTALASLDLVCGGAIAYEVRTTVHPVLTPPAALERLAGELASRGIRRWVLQTFRATGCANEDVVAAASGSAALSPATLERLAGYVPAIEVRG